VDRRKTSAFWSPRQPRPVPPPLPHDLRKSEDLIPLVGDRNGCGCRVIVSCDPDTIVFRFVVDPRAESSGDSNLVGGESGDHVVMTPIGEVYRGVTESRNEGVRLGMGERARPVQWKERVRVQWNGRVLVWGSTG
jgi:hypothetical protein